MNKKLSLKVSKSYLLFAFFVGALDLIVQIYLRSVNYGLNNSGISFGLLSGRINGLQNVVWVFLLAIFVFLILKLKDKNTSLYFMLIGGAVNISQRMIFGGVWDYIKLPFMPFTNNLSDILVTVGVLMYIIGL